MNGLKYELVTYNDKNSKITAGKSLLRAACVYDSGKVMQKNNKILKSICDSIWENQPVSDKSFFYLLRRAKMLSSKFGANLTLRLRVKCASFSFFPLASSCSNDFHTHVIINFLANWLVFLNTVT